MNDYKALAEKAWSIRRRYHAPVLTVAAPGTKHYDNRFFVNHSLSFVDVSITGRKCICHCAHCDGRLLQTMLCADTPEKLMHLVDRLTAAGCAGMLISGGADSCGEVELDPFIDAIKYACDQGLDVVVHTGLVNSHTAARLARTGVNQVLMDVIGDEDTIKNVYHINRKSADYLTSMQVCRQVGLKIAPHIVIGLNFGHITGEMQALEMIRQVDPSAIVLVVIMPLAGTDMAGAQPPKLAEAGKIIARARLMNPHVALSLGCARPSGLYKREIERLAVDCGINGIAYPDESTLDYAISRGLTPAFSEKCCSMIG